LIHLKKKQEKPKCCACNKIISDEVCEYWVCTRNETEKQKYLQTQTQLLLETQFGKSLHCPACSKLFIDDSPPIHAICAYCATKFCSKCEIPTWHSDFPNCETYQKSKGSVGTVDIKARNCPNKNCSVSIFKDGGCNHMTCEKCKIQFCWICMEIIPAHFGKAEIPHYSQKESKCYKLLITEYEK